MKVQVEVWANYSAMCAEYRHHQYVHGALIRRYIMDHNSPEQRRVLGEQCRNAFEAGQLIVTFPVQ